MTLASPVALLIGNDQYENLNSLEKARNDVVAVEQVLSSAGINTKTVQNAPRDDFLAALAWFHTEVQQRVGVIWFAGHGMSVDGKYLLMPVDAAAHTFSRDGIDLDQEIDLLTKNPHTRPTALVLIVDACRTVYFTKTSMGYRDAVLPTLTNEEPEHATNGGIFVLYSAGRNQRALDRLYPDDPHPNSVFTREFLRHLRPGVGILDLTIQVQRAVRLHTRVQSPAFYDQLSVFGSLYFLPVRRQQFFVENDYRPSLVGERIADRLALFLSANELAPTIISKLEITEISASQRQEIIDGVSQNTFDGLMVNILKRLPDNHARRQFTQLAKIGDLLGLENYCGRLIPNFDQVATAIVRNEIYAQKDNSTTLNIEDQSPVDIALFRDELARRWKLVDLPIAELDVHICRLVLIMWRRIVAIGCVALGSVDSVRLHTVANLVPGILSETDNKVQWVMQQLVWLASVIPNFVAIFNAELAALSGQIERLWESPTQAGGALQLEIEKELTAGEYGGDRARMGHRLLESLLGRFRLVVFELLSSDQLRAEFLLFVQHAPNLEQIVEFARRDMREIDGVLRAEFEKFVKELLPYFGDNVNDACRAVDAQQNLASPNLSAVNVTELLPLLTKVTSRLRAFAYAQLSEPRLNDDVIQERFASLPTKVQALIVSEELERVISDVCKEQRLRTFGRNLVAGETVLVLLGVRSPAKFAERLRDVLKLSENESYMIAAEISEALFVPVRVEMRAFMEAQLKSRNSL
jgi:hypothetical protein